MPNASPVPLVISVQPYMGSGQPEQELPAGGGSIVNSGGSINVYLTAIPGDYGVEERCFELVPGASLPWPTGQPCYAFTDEALGQIGSVYVSPIQTSSFPQAQTVVVNNTRDYSSDAYAQVKNLAPDYNLLDVIGNGVVVLDAKLYTAGGGLISDGTILAMESSEYDFCALTEDNAVDQYNNSAGAFLPNGDSINVNVISGSFVDGVWSSVHYIQL